MHTKCLQIPRRYSDVMMKMLAVRMWLGEKLSVDIKGTMSNYASYPISGLYMGGRKLNPGWKQSFWVASRTLLLRTLPVCHQFQYETHMYVIKPQQSQESCTPHTRSRRGWHCVFPCLSASQLVFSFHPWFWRQITKLCL